ncbi:MAG TPA: glycosyltransferase family 1 protein [Chryseolinea sp.]
MNPVRVLYDAPEFGMFQLTGHVQGVGRVVEEVARGLQASPDCDLRLMASFFQGLAGEWIAEKFPEAAFVHSPAQQFVSRVLTKAYNPQIMFDAERAHQFKIRLRRLATKGVIAPFRSWLRSVPDAVWNDVDLFHGNTGPIPGQIAKRRLPVFAYVHDLIRIRHPEFFTDVRPGEKERTRAALSHKRWYLCVSESTRNDLLELDCCDPAKVFVTPLAAGRQFVPNQNEERTSECRQKYGIGDSPFLLSVSTLEPRKNLDFVVRSFLKLVQEQNLPDLKLVLVGGIGWKYRGISEPLCEAGALRNRVIFTGFVPDADLPILYSEALAFVYMSLYEGFGLPPLEAMQCGAPVITSNSSSLPEVVGKAGITLDARDADGFCQALLSVATDRNLRNTMSQQSVAQAFMFSWERCTNNVIAAYRQSTA